MKKIVLVILLAVLVISMLIAFLVTRMQGDFVLGDKVAVVRVHGSISMSDDTGVFAGAGTTPQRVKEMLDKAERDNSVKAILVEINSPGGSVVPSEEISKDIKAASKPTVCWLGEIATSGGYYVASACDYIVADRATITGSLGVISIFPEFSSLMEKIGVNMTVIKAGEFKDFSTGFRPMTEEEMIMMEEVVVETYEFFISDVASNRNLSVNYLRGISGGRVYTGTKALELGLVDEVGDRDRAIEKAGELGGI
ncbi:MAG: signal peptide peptidase SppA, partial [Candidatus Hydrothermarchaeaceae archaeon]